MLARKFLFLYAQSDNVLIVQSRNVLIGSAKISRKKKLYGRRYEGYFYNDAKRIRQDDSNEKNRGEKINAN